MSVQEIKKHLVKDELPKNNQYVLVYINRDTWIDEDETEGDHCYKVVKFVRGLSIKDREKLTSDNPNKRLYSAADQHGNNLVPYHWESFGTGDYFGQEVEFWFNLPGKNS